MMIESCGVGSCPKVRFNFGHVHLSELIAEACSEVKTRRFFEWSKLILFDFDSIDRFNQIVPCSLAVRLNDYRLNSI